MFPPNIKTNCRNLIEKIISRRLITLSSHGYRDVEDIKKCKADIKIIFDVGANVGQSAAKFNLAFPEANIFCFEPIETTFKVLLNAVGNNPKVSCYQVALGDKEEDTFMYLTDTSLTSSIIEPASYKKREKISVQTLDNFIETNKIGKIDILKIDAEGFDLNVLKGAAFALTNKIVSFINIEVGFQNGDLQHIPFDDVKDFLLPFGYTLFGIYDQQLEWSGHRLAYANACFSNIEK